MLFLSQTVIIWHFWLWIIWSVCQCTIDKLKIKVKSIKLWQIISHSILTNKLSSYANSSCNSSKMKRTIFWRQIFQKWGKNPKKTVAHVCSSQNWSLKKSARKKRFVLIKRTIWANVSKYGKIAVKVWRILLCKYFHEMFPKFPKF